jgi:hypothetical protein
MQECAIKLMKSRTCPGRAAVDTFIEEHLAAGHLNLGVTVVDVDGDDGLGQATSRFVNDEQTLVVSVQFDRRYASDAMLKVLEIAQWTVETRAIGLEYEWTAEWGRDLEERRYLMRITWGS